jgi:hypothetical protein
MNKQSEQLGELFAALSKAQSQIKTAVTDSSNPFYKSKYTSLDGCWDAARGPLSSNGLAVIQTIGEDSGKLTITTILGHSSGQYLSSVLPLLLTKQDPQSMGLVVTYMRRYALCAIVGITQGDDDDAEEAMKENRTPAVKKKLEMFDFMSYLREKCPTEYSYIDMQEHMSDYLERLSQESRVNAGKIMDQAMKPELTQRFIKGFYDWVKSIKP